MRCAGLGILAAQLLLLSAGCKKGKFPPPPPLSPTPRSTHETGPASQPPSSTRPQPSAVLKPEAKAAAVLVVEGEICEFPKPVFFDFDRYEIRDDALPILEAYVRELAKRPELRLRVEGHCDERGSERYNMALGDRRANVVKAFLMEKGIAPERLDTISYGEERPFCSEHDEKCWALNRRAHFIRIVE